VDISGKRSRACDAEISSIGSPNVWPQPACRWSSSKRACDDARRSDPPPCHDGSTPVSAASRPYSSAPYIIIFVSVTEPRSWPTSPAEWNVEPEVRSARSTRTMSVQPRTARWYATDVPPTPPPMITARAWSALRSASRAAGSLVGPCHVSVTERAARVGDLALDRQELPVVVRRVERQPEHAVDRSVPELAVRRLGLELAELGAAGSHDELAKAARPGLDPRRVLRREPLVVVI